MRQRLYLFTLLLLGLLSSSHAQSNPYGVDPTATPIACTTIDLDFEDEQIPTDWLNVSLEGSRKWVLKTFDENTALRMTAFQSGSKCTTAFVSPLIEFPENEGRGYQLNFWSHTGYANGAKLVTKLLDRNGNVVQVLEEFIKESHPDWAPFWDEHILYLPDMTEPGYICFEYIGNDDNTQGPIMTTTYEIDDIVIEPANAEQELTASVSSYDFYSRAINEDHTYTITFLGRNLPEDIQLSLVDSSQVFTLSTTTLPKEGGELIITYHPTEGGSHSASLSATAGDLYEGIMLYGRGLDPSNPYNVNVTMTPQALDEDFEPYGWDDSGYNLPKGWDQIPLKGRVAWEVRDYSNNMFLQINPFGLGVEVETAVTTPLIDMDPTKSYTLSFDYNWGFANGAELSVLLLDKTGKVVKELTTLTHTDNVLWRDDFTPMEILLPSGCDDSFIAFLYKGLDSNDKSLKRTTAYRLDNIKVYAESDQPSSGSIKASESRVDFGEFLIGERDEYQIRLTGEGLSEDMTISLEGDEGFTISPTTLPKEGGDIIISFDAKKSGSFATKILVKSGEASLAIPVLATVEGEEDDDNDDDDEPTQGSYHFDTTATPISLNEDFESGSLPEGWSSQALVGTRQWIIKEYNSNQYAQFSAFKSGEQLTVGLITPLVAIDAAKEYELQFDLKSGFCNGATLKVCLYDAQGQLTKELKTFTATEPEQGYADNFTTESIVLPKGISNSFILFEYEGDDSSQSKRTTTYQVDNVKVSQITSLQDVVATPAYTIDGVKLILTGHSSLTLYTIDGTMVAHGDYPAMSQITLEPSRCYILLLNGITYKVMTRE